MSFRIKLSPLVFTLIVLFGLPLPSQAISISAFRIYLDADKPTTSFAVHNPDIDNQACSLRLTHYNFNENSELINIPQDEIPENSASHWVRFSPREFILTPANSQTIRFTRRRKASAEPAEYRSYLMIDCEAVSAIDDKKRLISIKPKLLHSVPVIVRNGDLDASISIANIKVEDKALRFSVTRSGSRSVYGDVALMDKDSEEVIASKAGFSIYPESERYNFNLDMKGYEPKDLKIRVTENIHYGGNLVYETYVQPE